MRLNHMAEAIVAAHGRRLIDDEPIEARHVPQVHAEPAPAAAPAAEAPAHPPASNDPTAGFPPVDPRIQAQLTPPPPAPAALPLPPTASPQQLALVDLALADPLNQALIQAYASGTVTPSSDIARDQVALYGAERFSKMQQLAQATASVRDRYIAALDAAQQNPPTDPAAACPPGWHWETDQPGRVADVDAFTGWYVQQDTLASRAFASLYGSSQTAAEAHGGEQVVSSTSVGNEMFHVSHGYWSQTGEHGEKSGWVGSSIGYRGGVTAIDAQGHPDLIDSKAVWFDPAMGFVTATENIKQKQNFFDKALPSLAAIGVTAALGGAGAFQAVGSLAGSGVGGTMLGAAAAGALTTFNSSMLATGSVHLKDILRSALTGAVTAGITNLAGLDQLGLQGNTVVSYADRAIAITGQATLQGALQQIAGGKFKDGFTAGLASGLAAEVTRGMQAGIEAKLKLNQISGAEASAYRLLTQATGSAIRMLSNPSDPGHAMAQDFLGTLVQDGAATVSQPAPMTLDQLRQSEHAQGNAQAAADAAIAAQEAFRVGEHSAASAPTEVALTRDQEERLKSGQTTTDFGDAYADGDGLEAGATGALRGRAAGMAGRAINVSQYAELLAIAKGTGPAAVLTVAIFGDQNMGSFQDVVPMEDGRRFVKAKDEMYGVVQERDANGEWKTSRTMVKLYQDRQLNRTVVLSDDDLRRLQAPTITPGTPLRPESTPGVAPASDRDRNTSTPGLETGPAAGPSVTTTPITPIDARDLIVDKSNSQALGENLRNAGDYPPKGYEGYEPHHMVPSNAGGPAMEAVRQRLQSFGINLNDAVNGVWLPTSRSAEGAPGAYHPRLNNDEYNRAIEQAFRNVTTRQDAEATLRDIKTQLQNETFPGVRPRKG